MSDITQQIDYDKDLKFLKIEKQKYKILINLFKTIPQKRMYQFFEATNYFSLDELQQLKLLISIKNILENAK